MRDSVRLSKYFTYLLTAIYRTGTVIYCMVIAHGHGSLCGCVPKCYPFSYQTLSGVFATYSVALLRTCCTAVPIGRLSRLRRFGDGAPPGAVYSPGWAFWDTIH